MVTVATVSATSKANTNKITEQDEMLARLSSDGSTKSAEPKKEKVDPNKKPEPRPGMQKRSIKALNKTVANDKNKPGVKVQDVPVNDADILDEVVIEEGHDEYLNVTKVIKNELKKVVK